MGTYLGILVDAKFFKGSHRTLNDTSVLKSIFRFSFTAALVFPFVLLGMFQMQYEDKLFNKVLFFFMLPCFFVSFFFGRLGAFNFFDIRTPFFPYYRLGEDLRDMAVNQAGEGSDLNGDGIVDGADLVELLSDWTL